MIKPTRTQVELLPDAEMRALGFTDHVSEQWYLCITVADGITWNITIFKNTGMYTEVALDEAFLQPYPYESLQGSVATTVRERISQEAKKLQALGLGIKDPTVIDPDQPRTNILPDGEMRALGFTTPEVGLYYFERDVAPMLSWCVTIDKETGAYAEDIRDIVSWSSYFYTSLSEQQSISDQIDREVAKLQNAGLTISAHHSLHVLLDD